MTKRVLCLLSEGFEEIETVTPARGRDDEDGGNG